MVLIQFLVFSQATTCFILNLSNLDFYFLINLGTLKIIITLGTQKLFQFLGSCSATL